MAEATSELREEIDERRDSIAATVDQIENRVSPTRIAARRTSRMRQRFTDIADSVFGNDDPDYPHHEPHGYGRAVEETLNEPGLVDRARDATGSLSDAPQQLRRQARGNPAAAGMISFGVGLLLGSVLPESRKERQMITDVQPKLNEAASQAASAAQDVVEDVKEPAKDAAESLKESATTAAQDVKSDAKSAAEDVKSEATN